MLYSITDAELIQHLRFLLGRFDASLSIIFVTSKNPCVILDLVLSRHCISHELLARLFTKHICERLTAP